VKLNKAILAKNSNLEPNTKYIGWCVAELWPFEVCHTLAGERTPYNGDRRPYVILNSVQCCYAVHRTDNNKTDKKSCNMKAIKLLFYNRAAIGPASLSDGLYPQWLDSI